MLCCEFFESIFYIELNHWGHMIYVSLSLHIFYSLMYHGHLFNQYIHICNMLVTRCTIIDLISLLLLDTSCPVTKSHPALCEPMDCRPLSRLLCPRGSPGKNTGVGCHFLFHGTLPDLVIKPMSPAL